MVDYLTSDICPNSTACEFPDLEACRECYVTCRKVLSYSRSISHGALSLSTCAQAPTVPGVYEARYFPAWLSGYLAGSKNDKYWGKARFTVKA